MITMFKIKFIMFNFKISFKHFQIRRFENLRTSARWFKNFRNF